MSLAVGSGARNVSEKSIDARTLSSVGKVSVSLLGSSDEERKLPDMQFRFLQKAATTSGPAYKINYGGFASSPTAQLWCCGKPRSMVGICQCIRERWIRKSGCCRGRTGKIIGGQKSQTSQSGPGMHRSVKLSRVYWQGLLVDIDVQPPAPDLGARLVEKRGVWRELWMVGCATLPEVHTASANRQSCHCCHLCTVLILSNRIPFFSFSPQHVSLSYQILVSVTCLL
jgi:hypothetical protein